jgi:hypothetical protein
MKGSVVTPRYVIILNYDKDLSKQAEKVILREAVPRLSQDVYRVPSESSCCSTPLRNWRTYECHREIR